MTTGVLLMAYGTPSGPDDVEAFYTDIRRGHAPSASQLDELRSRYQAIGGVSPLAQRTAAQVRAIAAALDGIAPNHYKVAYGAKHSHPKIEETVDSLSRAGAEAIVGLVLAPHFSMLSVGEYVTRARTRAESIGLRSTFIERWGTNPVLIDLLAERVREAISKLAPRAGDQVEVVFT
ncbi:MAG TPA: ferrochelatase, partial [Acidimicrobiales bacterium]|nr:ferrochelatase [Acidimicrobiales bacterium]